MLDKLEQRSTKPTKKRDYMGFKTEPLDTCIEESGLWLFDQFAVRLVEWLSGLIANQFRCA